MQLVRNGFGIAAISAEIAKCDVRCRNCHAIATYERLGGDWRSDAMRNAKGFDGRSDPAVTDVMRIR